MVRESGASRWEVPPEEPQGGIRQREKKKGGSKLHLGGRRAGSGQGRKGGFGDGVTNWSKSREGRGAEGKGERFFTTVEGTRMKLLGKQDRAA